MSTEILVRVEGLERYYGEHAAVRGVSFDVKRGEVLGFLGPNGAGKSTTMQIIAGSLAPSAGQVIVNGADILDRPREAKRQTGYLPEQPPLYRELTVDEYLRYSARLHGITRKGIDSAMQRAKSRCGLNDAGRRLIGNLSKGYQQRVGIAQAIIHSPAVVILDEPTVGLDPIQVREIRSLIRELGGEHSVILSTHILPEVQTICDRVQIIHQGSLVLNEDLADLSTGMPGAELTVGFREPPAAGLLKDTFGLAHVESIGAGRFRLRPEPGTDPTDELVSRSVSEQWGLNELTPHRQSLEDVFVQLTCGEDPSAESPSSGVAEETAT
ncbi:MAG: ATP-binding cassette domain-containing protein [Gammaproteobacteria bacterium]|nr:ATP-binding cassette domain-containing protein [Gammaproteobacteria bacterium]